MGHLTMIKRIYDDQGRPIPGRFDEQMPKETGSVNHIAPQSDLNQAALIIQSPPQRRPFEITKGCLEKIGISRNAKTGIWEYRGGPLREVSTERFIKLIQMSTRMGVHHFWQDHMDDLFSDPAPLSIGASDATALFEAVRYDLCKVHIIDKFHGGKA